MTVMKGIDAVLSSAVSCHCISLWCIADDIIL